MGSGVDYDYNGTGYAGATKTMDMLNLSGYDGFTMYLDSDGSGNEIKVQMETDTSTYAYTGYMTGKGPMIMYMPFSKIIQPDWATSGTPQPIDSSQNLKSVSIYTNQSGQVASGTFMRMTLRAPISLRIWHRAPVFPWMSLLRRLQNFLTVLAVVHLMWSM